MTIDSTFQSFPELVTARLVLRRIKIVDADMLFRILSDHDVTRFYDDAPFVDLSQALEQIESWEHGFTQQRTIRWAITLKGDPILIGTCGFYSIHPWHLRASIGFELAHQYWRRGYMSESLSAIISLGFKEMGLNRIDAVVMPENVSSIMMLSKLGFTKEGLLRGYEKWGDKGFVDLGMHSITREEWALLSKGMKID